MEERERARARRRRRRRQRQSKVKWTRLIIVGIILIAVLSGIGWGLYTGVSYVYRSITGYSENTVEETSDKQDVSTVSVEQKRLDKPVYVLVVGTDENNPSQGDSLFLLSINIDQKTMDIIGIPSNSKIDNRDQTATVMLNTMYEKGGIELTKAVVEDMFHISIPYYIVVNQDAFKKTNDVLGDQQIYVEQNMEHFDAEGVQDIDLRRGYQTLNSDKALAYLRYSDPKNDTFTRLQRQERFLKLWVENEHNSFFLTNAWHIWRVWDYYESNISTMDAIKLMYNVGRMNKDQIHFYILPGEKEVIEDKTYWNINPTEAQRLVGIMMGTLPANEMTQFISAPTNSTTKRSDDSEDSKKATTKPTEPGDDNNAKKENR